MAERMVKNTIKGGLNKVFLHLNDSLHIRFDELSHRLDNAIEQVQNTELTINHNQLTILEEINRHIKNTGTVYLSPTEILTKIFSGLKMYLDPRDVAVVPHLALDSIWEHRITAAWLAVIQPTDTVIDIGANFGYFGALAAQKTDKKKSKVIFFEANPHLIPYIQKTLSVNWLNEQSAVENFAVGDKKGKVPLHILKDYIGSSSIHPSEEVSKYMGTKMRVETAETVVVQAVALDDYCKQHDINTLNLIKMDIEGYEEKAYKGMRKIIKQSPEVTLFVEFTKDAYEQARGFYDQMLADFGYVYVIDDEGYITRPADTSYETVIGRSDDWVMPIFSKKPNLANR